jgi:hypothetical protein
MVRSTNSHDVMSSSKSLLYDFLTGVSGTDQDDFDFALLDKRSLGRFYHDDRDKRQIIHRPKIVIGGCELG